MNRQWAYILVMVALFIVEGIVMLREKKRRELLVYSFITITAILLGYYYLKNPFSFSFSDSIMSIFKIEH